MKINRNGAEELYPSQPQQPQRVQRSEQQAPVQPPQSEEAPVSRRDAPAEEEFISAVEKHHAQAEVSQSASAQYSAKEAAPSKRKSRSKPQTEDFEEEEEVKRRHFPFGCLIFVVLMALVVFAGFQVAKLYGEIKGGSELGTEMSVDVPQGSSVASIATLLQEQGIIEHGDLFKLYAKYSGKANNLQYGTFQLRSGMSYNDILSTLSVQQVFQKTITVTFPEGSTAVAIAQLMEENGLCTAQEFLDCANGADGSDFSNYTFWNEIPDNGRIMKCEGYLFPETYEFFEDDTVYNYVDTFYKEFDKRTSDLMDTIAEKGTTIDNVVILASFIQEEAGLPEEDKKVSAVFHNRLESTDPLWSAHMLESNACSYIMNDSDNNYLWNSPTAEYMGWVANGEIPADILAIYDTYQVSGLPAGPISCPGYDAIEAALNPDEEFMAEGYYFFVTGNPNGDYPGQYFYAKTADEHYQNCVKAGWA